MAQHLQGFPALVEGIVVLRIGGGHVRRAIGGLECGIVVPRRDLRFLVDPMEYVLARETPQTARKSNEGRRCQRASLRCKRHSAPHALTRANDSHTSGIPRIPKS